MSVAEAAAAARAAGFGGIEFTIGLKGPITPETDEARCRRYRDEVARAGLMAQTLASGMTWECSCTHADPAVRKRAVELHRAALQRAAWLGCMGLLFVPGAVMIPWNASYAPVRYDLAVQWAREAVMALAADADRLGVDVLIENVWNGMFYSPLELAAFVDGIGHPRVGVYFDVGNVLGLHQHPPHWIEILGRRIRRVHIKDFKRSVGNLSGFCPLLEGDMPWPQTMAALRQIGYDSTIVAEVGAGFGTLEHTSRVMDTILAM